MFDNKYYILCGSPRLPNPVDRVWERTAIWAMRFKAHLPASSNLRGNDDDGDRLYFVVNKFQRVTEKNTF